MPGLTPTSTGLTPTSTGSNTVTVTATDYSAAQNVTTKQYAVTVSGGAARTLAYDAAGDLLSITATGQSTPERTQEWDAAGRLAAVEFPASGQRSEFSYDGLGRRVRVLEMSGGVTTADRRFVWEGLSIAEERDAANAVVKRFYGQGVQAGGSSHYYTRDHLGSVRELTDSAGTVRGRWDYGLWGRRSANLVTTNAVAADFGYTGHFEHTASGLTLAPYRAYDAELGRWLSRDPIGEEGGANLYGFCRNEPTGKLDPLGNAWRDPCPCKNERAGSLIRRALDPQDNDDWLDEIVNLVESMFVYHSFVILKDGTPLHYGGTADGEDHWSADRIPIMVKKGETAKFSSCMKRKVGNLSLGDYNEVTHNCRVIEGIVRECGGCLDIAR